MRGNFSRLLKKSFDAEALKKLRRALHGRRRVLVVVPDSTRKAHLKEALPFILRIIDNFCRGDIIVATGLHIPLKKRELAALVGEGIYRRYWTMSHSQAKSDLASFGRTKGGIAVVLNRRLRDYDGIITIGVIEPHLYAGYSGGAKTVAIGLAGEEIINATHGPRFLDDPRVAIGEVEGNPFQKVLWDIAGRLPVIFSVNMVNDSKGNTVEIFSGPMKEAFRAGVRCAKDMYGRKFGERADIVVTKLESPKDRNLYQASRAINYVVNSKKPILKDGGTLIFKAGLEDGLGRGLGERRCFEALKAIGPLCRREDVEAFIGKVRSRGCLGGEHRAYMIARALLKCRVVVAGENAPRVVKGLPFKAFRTLKEALAYAKGVSGSRPRVHVIARALSTIAEIG